MCGIVGIINTGSAVQKDQTNRTKAFVELLFVDALRGTDATGIVFADYTGTLEKPKVLTYKRALEARDFLNTPKAKNFINESNWYNFWIGHNRAATKGGTWDYNSHPFHHGNIIGVHNGTLFTHNNLPDGKDFIVDSEAIIYSINKIGIVDTVELIDGAFALSYYDKENNSLNLIRNSDRPLFFGEIDDNGSFVYASEEGMLKWISTRNGLTLKKVYDTGVGQLVTFTDNGDYTVKKLKLKAPTVYYGNNYGNSYGRNNSNYNSFGPTQETILRKINKKFGDTIEFTFQEFKPYQYSPELGRIIGYMEVEPFYSVEASSIKSNQFDWKKKKGATFVGIITSAYNFNGEYPTLSLKDIKLLDTRTKGKKKECKDITVVSENTKETEYLYGPQQSIVTVQEWKRLTTNGCGFCGEPLMEEDHEEIEWLGDSPVCPYCSIEMKTNGGIQ